MKELLKSVFGNKLERYDEIKRALPLYLKDGRRFFDVSIAGHAFILVYIQRQERFNINGLKKQLVSYQKAFQSTIVCGFDRISFFQRKTLIENDISFVAGNEQIYMPFLGLLFGKCYQEEEVLREHFMPVTQALFLLFLYEKNSYTKSEAADRLKLQPMSISRASKQLYKLGLIQEEKKGTNIVMTINYKDRKLFYEHGERYMINPVQSVVYVQNARVNAHTPEAGVLGLSRRSDIGYPDYIEYAFYRETPGIRWENGVDPDLFDSVGLVRIQKWKYDPLLFAHGHMLDPVSLICSFKDNSDERISKCLDQVKEEIWTWQITQS